MDPASKTPASVAFGRFRVLPHRRELLADGSPVKLGGRATCLTCSGSSASKWRDLPRFTTVNEA
jgi:hypothetical protein